MSFPRGRLVLDLATLSQQGVHSSKLVRTRDSMKVAMSLYGPVTGLNLYPKVFAGTIVSERGRISPDRSIRGNCI